MKINVKRVNEFLKFRNWRQADLARAIKVSPAQISLLMSGDRGLTVRMIDKLCEVTSLPANELFINEKQKGRN
ncbi:MAG: helix-turn-helix transcriptional regulator [Candidatus Omnitrophica bacterium]|nr:helix-turn-helix transcriptional regulator [Candidatus Omnitrophota bacterium]